MALTGWGGSCWFHCGSTAGALPVTAIAKDRSCAQLKQERKFWLGRKLLDRYAEREEVRQHPDARLRRKFGQQRALCTYKDPDLPAEDRLDRALGILEAADPLDRSTDQETLGQAGAVYKRKWELTGHRQHLETALDYYLRGHQEGVVNDYGYTAVNAAFVLDLLADLAESGARPAAASYALAEQRRQQAQTIRQEIARALPPLVANPDTAWLAEKWWFLVTLGEACFGLER